MSRVPEGLGLIAGALSRIAPLASRAALYAPLLTRSRVCCAVDADLRVHVIRTAAYGGPEAEEMRPIEAATLAPGGGEPRFRPISPPLFCPAFPVMAPLGDAWVVGVVAAPSGSEEVRSLQSYQGLLTHSTAGPQEMPSLVLHRTSGAMRLAVAPGSAVFVLGQPWFPPPALLAASPLQLASFVAGEGTMLADPIRGTSVPGSAPLDAALHASADGRLHLVYDGLRGIPRSPPRLYHVILRPSGAIAEVTDLAPAPYNTVLSAIVPAPDGRLFYFNASLAEEGSTRLVHTMIRLDARDAPGPKERYFVDCWLRPHVVWFDGDGARCAGPDSVPAPAS